MREFVSQFPRRKTINYIIHIVYKVLCRTNLQEVGAYFVLKNILNVMDISILQTTLVLGRPSIVSRKNNLPGRSVLVFCLAQLYIHSDHEQPQQENQTRMNLALNHTI